MSSKMKKMMPLGIILLVIVIDQLLKSYIVANYELYEGFGQGFFNITHVRNIAAGFSLGAGWSGGVRLVMFIILPVIALVFGLFLLVRDTTFSFASRIAFSLILGGGFGNVIDRVFRPEGVVDMFDVTFFGIFGWERWPTFNIADVAIVSGAILLIITVLFTGKGEKNE